MSNRSRHRQIAALRSYLRYTARGSVDPNDPDATAELHAAGVPKDLVDGAQTVAQALYETTSGPNDPDRPWTVDHRRADEVLAKFADTIEARAARGQPDGAAVADTVRDRQRGPVVHETPTGFELDLGPKGETVSRSIDDEPSVPWRQ